IALFVLAPFAIPKLAAQPDLFRAHWRLWTVFGIVTVAGFNSAYYIGLQYTTVVQCTLISAVLPILVLLAARIFLNQPITGATAYWDRHLYHRGCHHRRARCDTRQA